MAPRSARAVVLPRFGRRLLTLRGDRTLRDVCHAVGRSGLELNPTTLLHYEQGVVAAPDPAILWVLARTYRVSVDKMLMLIWMDRTGQPMRAGMEIAKQQQLTREQLRLADWFGKLRPSVRDYVRDVIDRLAVLVQYEERATSAKRRARE